MSNRSIRFRLTVWYSLALTAGLVIFGFATWLSMRHSLLRDLNRSLAERVQSAQAFTAAEAAEPKTNLKEELDEYSRGLPVGSFLQVRSDTGAVVFTSNPEFPWPANPADRSKERRLAWKRHSYLLLSEAKRIDGQPWRFAMSTPLGETDRLLERLRFFLFTLVPAVIAAAAIGGSWLSRRALKPVDELTAAARSISFENLSERLRVPQTGDELARLAETWNSMLSRLEQTIGRQARFTADASHELRTPLAVIRMTAELAARRNRPPESYRQALIRVVSESERMTKLLDDLLLLARVDADSVDLPKATFDLAVVVGQLCSQMQPLAETKHLHLTFLPSSESTSVAANEPAIRRLVLVLLDNAIKYSRSGGEVAVSLRRDGEKIHLEIADSGPGIKEEELPHIFERFYRSPQVRHASPEGTGLGLSLAASIAQKHNAEIAVTRSSEQGSTFSVFFGNAA